MEVPMNVVSVTPQKLAIDANSDVAFVKNVELELYPIVGCPLSPAIQSFNLDIKKSKFQWFVSQDISQSQNEAVWTPDRNSVVHEGFSYTPRPEDIDRFVRLCVLSLNSCGQPGYFNFSTQNVSQELNDDCFITTSKPVAACPPQNLINQRIAEVAGHDRAFNEFRLVSYNVLAAVYTEKSTNTLFHRHCPVAYLDFRYRFPLIHRELLAYSADVLCLQEVDSKQFYHRLSFLMDTTSDFDGCYLSKLSFDTDPNADKLPELKDIDSNARREEGVAIYYRRNRFRLIEKIPLDSLVMHAEEAASGTYLAKLAEIYHRIAERKELPVELCEQARSHGVLVCLLECLHTGRRFLLANTHLYYNPEATELRNIQCLILRHYLIKLAEDLAESGGPLPIIIGADLNTDLDSKPYHNLVEGPPSDKDDSLDNSCLLLRAAVPLPKGVYTNIVPGFKSNLDAILYGIVNGTTKDGLYVSRAFSVPTETEVLEDGRNANPEFPPLLSEEEGGFTLPNSQFPSDHLALIVDFGFSQLNHKKI